MAVEKQRFLYGSDVAAPTTFHPIGNRRDVPRRVRGGVFEVAAENFSPGCHAFSTSAVI